MDFLALSLRMCAPQGDDYLPYTFKGDWSSVEKQMVVDAISPNVPERVDAMFNNWLFVESDPNFFMCKRATWDEVQCFRHAQEMADFITEYYNRYK